MVTFHFVASLDAGTIVDSSEGQAPIWYIHGETAGVPTLQRSLAHCKVGDRIEVVLDPEEAYGASDPRLRRTIARDEFPSGTELRVGQTVTATPAHGRAVTFRIADLGDETVVADFNHPAAGRRVRLSITVVGVREATAAEVAAERSSPPAPDAARSRRKARQS